MKKIRPDFVLFDMIGTTIQDTNNGKSIILDSFHQAFKNSGYDIPYEILNQQRGKTKRVAIQTILSNDNLNQNFVDEIYHHFIHLLNASVSTFVAIDGAREIFNLLKKANIKIGIGSGLPLTFMHQLLAQLNWEPSTFDYIGSSDELAAGRPDPIMILDAKKQLNLDTKATILKIGDTIVDVQEGKNANVLTAMVQTGTQSTDALDSLTPDYILDSVKDLKHIIRLL